METRLSESYDPPSRLLHSSNLRLVGEVIVKWEKSGLNAEGLVSHLQVAAWDRFEYEEKLRAIAYRKEMGKRARRKDLATIEASGPLIELMKKSRAALPGDPEVLLAEVVQTWANDYVEAELARGGKKLARGRPGEPWLHRHVIHLAGQLRHVGQSWNRTLQLVYEACVAIGMNDVVTREKVRHIIRAERTRRPGFGRGGDQGCEQCVGSSGIGKILGDAYDFEGRDGLALVRQFLKNPKDMRILQKVQQRYEKVQKQLDSQKLLLRKKFLLGKKGSHETVRRSGGRTKPSSSV